MMTAEKTDKLPWLLLPCIMLTLGGATLLVPRHPALAATPAVAAAPKPAAEAYDDGDGDELLEHWGDAKYAREERFQLAGLTGGFLLLGVAGWRKRILKKAPPVATQSLQDESHDRRKAA